MPVLTNKAKDDIARAISLRIFEETMDRVQKAISDIHGQGCDPAHAVSMIKFVGMGVLACSLEFMETKESKSAFAEALSGELFLHLKNYLETRDGVVENKIILQ